MGCRCSRYGTNKQYLAKCETHKDWRDGASIFAFTYAVLANGGLSMLLGGALGFGLLWAFGIIK